MSQDYSRACLRIAVAQICQHLGWNSIHNTPLELLTDVLERYLLQLGKTTHRYSELFGRTEARIEDVFNAFTDMGMQVHELEDYIKHVEPLPFAKETVAFPAPQQNDLKFPNPESKEVQQRKVFEYIPEHLPYMHPELNEEEPEDINQSARVPSPVRLQVEPQRTEMSPVPGEKRPVSSPGESSFKRQRLTTSQPLPEEASQSQYQMTSVVMTHSGILSPIREGKVPDSKAPPAGFKQIVIVRSKKPTATNQVATPGIKLPADTSVIKLDFSQDTSKGPKIVEVSEERDAGAFDDRNDPDYRPKAKKKFKEFKKERMYNRPYIKRGPGRPRSPGRASVVHNRGAMAFSRIPAMSHMSQESSTVPGGQDMPIDLSMKPTPPMPNINVIKSGGSEQEVRTIDYRPKVTTLSEQQEKDFEDTIASVIRKKSTDSLFNAANLMSKEGKSKDGDEWCVKSIRETYGDDEDSDHNEPEHKQPTTIAPHLQFLYGKMESPTVTPRPRGRPRGSTSSFYRGLTGRSPMGGRRGRPPLHRGSPGRPPLNRSPGRPPLSRSPGRPPLNRSPGRPPSSGRSPGRPKGSGMSPRPRGRPRGSKSPRSRGASPRGGSPRSAIAQLSFDEQNESVSNESKNTNIFKLENEDSQATLFEFPSKSSTAVSSPKKEAASPPSTRRGSSAESSSIASPAPTEPAGSSGSREMSPDLSPRSDVSEPVKREPVADDFHPAKSPTPEPVKVKKEVQESVETPDTDRKSEERESDRKFVEREPVRKSVEPEDVRKSVEPDVRTSVEREPLKEKVRQDEVKLEKGKSHEREHKEHSRERDREKSKEHRKDKKKKKKKNKDRDKERDREEDRDRERKEKHKEKKEREREKEPREESPSVQPLQKLKIKFGGGSSTAPGSFSISAAQPAASPKPETASPTRHIPKLTFRMLPPKSDASAEGDKSWVSSIKTEPDRQPSPKPEPLFGPRVRSPTPSSKATSPRSKVESDSDELSDDLSADGKTSRPGEDEVTVSVVKGKIVKKPAKRGKRKGSSTKRKKLKGEGSRKEGTSLFGDVAESTVAAVKKEPDKEASPISPPFSPQNVPSPITIPALKAAPPPPSPPAPSKKISPPKPRQIIKEQKPMSPLVKEVTKPAVIQIPKGKAVKSPKKSSKISPPPKKKGSMSPPKTSPSKSFPFMDFQTPRTPSPRRSTSPSPSVPTSPMYSPASSPGRESPLLHFQIPPTPALPTRTHSPPASPPSRQLSTDEETEGPSVSDKPRMPPPDLPPMPPTSAQRKAQRTVITETVGSFVNELGEKVWICPACTMQDDGSPMIGCDVCDDWYHWVCVGIKEEPSEDEPWYCSKCVKPSKSKSKRGRKKRRS